MIQLVQAADDIHWLKSQQQSHNGIMFKALLSLSIRITIDSDDFDSKDPWYEKKELVLWDCRVRANNKNVCCRHVSFNVNVYCSRKYNASQTGEKEFAIKLNYFPSWACHRCKASWNFYLKLLCCKQLLWSKEESSSHLILVQRETFPTLPQCFIAFRERN